MQSQTQHNIDALRADEAKKERTIEANIAKHAEWVKQVLLSVGCFCLFFCFVAGEGAIRSKPRDYDPVRIPFAYGEG